MKLFKTCQLRSCKQNSRSTIIFWPTTTPYKLLVLYMNEPLIFHTFQGCFEPLLGYAEPFADRGLGALVVLVCIEIRSCSFNLGIRDKG